ncbi:ATP-binding protein [Thermobifida cellulosilytica]|uniref:Uncharacterized protein n=1 Tax=Thermobifida cellulosilytica TB100 TaxID=665004 RepID=A0A147KFN4_THECS|nr:hypothetical protein [Thermobifida cellulosilytica]KUP96070.1 hypothetical protein AC529_14250 [Thermobifida cellulosilytica TB100]
MTAPPPLSVPLDEFVLRYPRHCLVLLGGLPGAGKSTLLGRLYGLTGAETATVRTGDGAHVVDSLQSRNRLTPLLGALPYPLWRWVTHLLHYLRVLAALCGGGPVIVHDAGTRRAVRLLFALYCRLTGAELHLLFVAAAPAEALLGQITRGRRVGRRSFRGHVRRWRALLDAVARDPRDAVPEARSLVLLNRAEAALLRRIDFGPRPHLSACPAHRSGRSAAV